jgi:hypothetical protein
MEAADGRPEDWISRLDSIRLLEVSGWRLDQLIKGGQLQTAKNAEGKSGLSRSSVESYRAIFGQGGPQIRNPFSLRSIKRGGKKVVEGLVDGIFDNL